MIHAFSIQPMIFKQFFKKGSMLIRVVIFSKKKSFHHSSVLLIRWNIFFFRGKRLIQIFEISSFSGCVHSVAKYTGVLLFFAQLLSSQFKEDKQLKYYIFFDGDENGGRREGSTQFFNNNVKYKKIGISKRVVVVVISIFERCFSPLHPKSKWMSCPKNISFLK